MSGGWCDVLRSDGVMYFEARGVAHKQCLHHSAESTKTPKYKHGGGRGGEACHGRLPYIYRDVDIV